MRTCLRSCLVTNLLSSFFTLRVKPNRIKSLVTIDQIIDEANIGDTKSTKRGARETGRHALIPRVAPVPHLCEAHTPTPLTTLRGTAVRANCIRPLHALRLPSNSALKKRRPKALSPQAIICAFVAKNNRSTLASRPPERRVVTISDFEIRLLTLTQKLQPPARASHRRALYSRSPGNWRVH